MSSHKATSAVIPPVALRKLLVKIENGPQICETPRQEGAGRLFCIARTRDRFQSRECHRHSGLKATFQKLSEKAISPHQATPGSVGYDLFTPIDFQIQPKEQKTVFIDLAIAPPEGYYAQHCPSQASRYCMN